MNRNLVAVCVASVVWSAAVLAQVPARGSDPGIGVWRLNLEKSRYSPGPPPRSELRQYSPRESGWFVLTITGVSSAGNLTFSQSVFNVDGRDRPIYNQADLATFLISGERPAVTFSQKQVDAHTIEATQRVNGRPTVTVTRTVSEDGKTLTLTTKGTNAQGQRVDNVAVYVRQ